MDAPSPAAERARCNHDVDLVNAVAGATLVVQRSRGEAANEQRKLGLAAVGGHVVASVLNDEGQGSNPCRDR